MIPRLLFVGFVVFLGMGILLGEYLSRYFVIDLYFVLAASTVLAAISIVLYSKRLYTLLSVFFASFLLVSGSLSAIFQTQYLHQEVARINAVPYSAYEAVVKTLPEKRQKSVRIEISVKHLKTANGWVSSNTRALISIPLDAPAMPAPGDRMLVVGRMVQPKMPLNPGEFDYRKYLWNKGIVWTGYLPSGSYQVLKGNDNTWNPLYWSIYVSEWADHQFRANLRDNRAYGLVKAMLLGRRDDLRSDQVDDYTTSGTVHILSVSGMHVALIFLVISLLCGWMKKLKGGKYIYLGSVTTLLFFYSVITGFPPSVQRATVMCIVLVIAEVFQKKHNSVNSLGVSAFLILLLDPFAVFDVGFQLSYLAMLGIFLFYKPLENAWTPSGWLLQKTWQVTALSFAAQLATFPLSIYYFHQFPSYFWLVNPFIIAFTNALLPAAMLLLAVSLFPIRFLQLCINWIVEMLAYLTNVSAAVPKSLPGFLIDNLYLDRMEVVLLYIILLVVWYGYESREYKWFKVAAMNVVLLVIYACSVSMQTYLTPQAVFHAVPKHSVITFKEGEKLYISSDKAFETDTNAFNFYIKNYAVSQGVQKRIFLNESSVNSGNIYYQPTAKGVLLQWMGKSIYRGPLTGSLSKSFRPALDYHLLTGVKYPRKGQVKVMGGPTFLLGGELGYKTAERWKEVINDSGYEFYDLWSDGALLLR